MQEGNFEGWSQAKAKPHINQGQMDPDPEALKKATEWLPSDGHPGAVDPIRVDRESERFKNKVEGVGANPLLEEDHGIKIPPLE